MLPNTQLNYFDFISVRKNPLPKFTCNQIVFILSLDIVLIGYIGNSWICEDFNNKSYYEYSINFDNGLHTVVWDRDIEKMVFTNIEEAQKCANLAENALIKVDPQTLDFIDLHCYEYIRESDNKKLTATLAKVGDNQIYEHEFMCYHFLREYPNTQKRDKEYNNLLNKICKEAKFYNAIELNYPVIEVLYKVEDCLYSSREFAENKIRIQSEMC